MKIRVKICGITRPEDALLAEKLGASAVGFIFFGKSPRYINPQKAGEISGRLGPFIARVGVFVDEDAETVRKIVETARLTAVQLHGSEDQEYIGILKGINVIKAFRVGKDFNCEELCRYDVNTFLLDTYSANSYGGTGKTFDWNIANECRKYGRIILAGGLNISNVIDAVNAAKPWGIDISSGIESSPGVKDPEKMKEIFDKITGQERI